MSNEPKLTNETQEKILEELKFIAEHIIFVENLSSAILSKLNGERGPRILPSTAGRQQKRLFSANNATLN